MADSPTGRYRDDLLIEHVAAAFGFDRLSEALPGPAVYPPYLFVATGLFVEYGLFDLYNYFVTGKSSFVTQPNSLAIPAMVVVGVVGLRYVHDTYADSVRDLGVEDDAVGIDADVRPDFEGLVSFRVRVGAYLAALAVYYAFVVFVLGVDSLVEISGVGLVLYAQLVSFPLIVVPVLVELAVSYVAVHALVPRRIARADLGLFFYDPRNLGGFEPVGRLLKRSYYIYTAILLLWFVQTHAPVVLSTVISSPYPPPGPVIKAAISAAWLVGVATIGYSMYRIHAIMKRKKSARIRALEADLKDAVKDPYDAHRENIEDRERYDEVQENLAQVRGTKTYPTTFAMWSQIFVSVLLPQALNMVL
ncbi:MAG: hypothetical protein ABEJ70_07380 [Halobacteriaceae archaeon]